MPRELGGTPQSQDSNVWGEALADAAATVLQKPGKPESGDHHLQERRVSPWAAGPRLGHHHGGQVVNKEEQGLPPSSGLLSPTWPMIGRTQHKASRRGEMWSAEPHPKAGCGKCQGEAVSQKAIFYKGQNHTYFFGSSLCNFSYCSRRNDGS